MNPAWPGQRAPEGVRPDVVDRSRCPQGPIAHKRTDARPSSADGRTTGGLLEVPRSAAGRPPVVLQSLCKHGCPACRRPTGERASAARAAKVGQGTAPRVDLAVSSPNAILGTPLSRRRPSSPPLCQAALSSPFFRYQPAGGHPVGEPVAEQPVAAAGDAAPSCRNYLAEAAPSGLLARPSCVSYIRTATRAAEPALMAAAAQTAACRPRRSATMPPRTAPTAYPRSRQTR